MPKVSQNGQIKKKKCHHFSGSKLPQQIDSGLKQLKMDLNALKCIQIHIPQKGPINVKKWQKMS